MFLLQNGVLRKMNSGEMTKFLKKCGKAIPVTGREGP
jgi:hypothetical protein